jgi:hypothetical protein
MSVQPLRLVAVTLRPPNENAVNRYPEMVETMSKLSAEPSEKANALLVIVRRRSYSAAQIASLKWLVPKVWHVFRQGDEC